MAVISECVVGCKKMNGNFVIAKNRDRSYSPVIKIVHHVDKDNEVMFLFDEESKYAEGLNVKAGFGILNTATENSEDFGALVSEEGHNIMRALIADSAKQALKSMTSKGYEVYGNTIVSDGENSYLLEFVKDADPVIKNVTKRKNPTVRTNHTVYIPEGGFRLGEDDQDYISSKTRRAVAEVVFTNSENVEDLLDSLNYNLFGDHSAYDLHRNTTGYKTRSQVALDPIAKKMYYRSVPGREKFTGVVKSGDHSLPCQGEVAILDYREELDPPFLTWSASMHTPPAEKISEVMLHKILNPKDKYNDTSGMTDIEVAKLNADKHDDNVIYFIKRESEIIKKLVAIQDLIRNKDTAMMHLLSGVDADKEYERICDLIDQFESKALKLFQLYNADLQNDTVNEAEKRTPRKKGQKKKSSKHSDLFTDEDPKGTIHGLGFKDAATARAGVTKVNKAKRKHAHKVQATLVMKQRGKVAIERTKDPEKKKNLKAANKIWSDHLEKLKKKTKKMNESAIKILLREYIKDVIK